MIRRFITLFILAQLENCTCIRSGSDGAADRSGDSRLITKLGDQLVPRDLANQTKEQDNDASLEVLGRLKSRVAFIRSLVQDRGKDCGAISESGSVMLMDLCAAMATWNKEQATSKGQDSCFKDQLPQGHLLRDPWARLDWFTKSVEEILFVLNGEVNFAKSDAAENREALRAANTQSLHDVEAALALVSCFYSKPCQTYPTRFKAAEEGPFALVDRALKRHLRLVTNIAVEGAPSPGVAIYRSHNQNGLFLDGQVLALSCPGLLKPTADVGSLKWTLHAPFCGAHPSYFLKGVLLGLSKKESSASAEKSEDGGQTSRDIRVVAISAVSQKGDTLALTISKGRSFGSEIGDPVFLIYSGWGTHRLWDQTKGVRFRIGFNNKEGSSVHISEQGMVCQTSMPFPALPLTKSQELPSSSSRSQCL